MQVASAGNSSTFHPFYFPRQDTSFQFVLVFILLFSQFFSLQAHNFDLQSINYPSSQLFSSKFQSTLASQLFYMKFPSDEKLFNKFYPSNRKSKTFFSTGISVMFERQKKNCAFLFAWNLTAKREWIFRLYQLFSQHCCRGS